MDRGKASTVVKRVVEVFEDDIDGGSADVTVSFALDGTAYEIDLSEQNAVRLREALQPYVAAARPVAKRRLEGRSSAVPHPAEVRKWARDNGIEVNDRGRIPESVLAAYRAAHGG